MHRSRALQALHFVSPTSNIVEHLLSIMESLRDMDPRSLELLVMLRANKDDMCGELR